MPLSKASIFELQGDVGVFCLSQSFSFAGTDWFYYDFNFFHINLIFVPFLAEKDVSKACCLRTSLYLLMANETSWCLLCSATN